MFYHGDRYERYEKNRQAVSQGPASKVVTQPQDSLIDLSNNYPQSSASAAAAALPTITTHVQALSNLSF